MLTSMTGFGRAEHSTSEISVTCEVRSVNHRYLDISFRMPREFSVIEERARACVAERIARGKAEVFISVEWLGENPRVVVFDSHLARAYYEGLARLAAELAIDPAVSVERLAGFPDVVAVKEQSRDPETLWAAVEPALTEAVQELVRMRRVEGERLESDIMHRIGKIEQVLHEIGQRAPDSVESYRERLNRRVAEMMGDLRVDEARLATEIALFADRCDYTEETVRFLSHIQQFRRTVNETGSVGKKLDFITQEMNREANTIASKAQDQHVSALVVEIKAELEKVREQVQNVE